MTKTFIVIVVGVLVLVGGYFLLSRSALAPSEENGGTSLEMPAPGFENVPEMIVVQGGAQTVTYTANGFSPASLTVKKGETVTFINQSGQTMWVASAMHPTHSVYSGTTLSEHCGGANDDVSFDQCEAGVSYSFTFQKSGTWKYHNHNRTDDTGAIVVQ